MSETLHTDPRPEEILPAVDEKNIAGFQHAEDVHDSVKEKDLVRQAADRAEIYEHQLTTWQAFKTYKAVSRDGAS